MDRESVGFEFCSGFAYEKIYTGIACGSVSFGGGCGELVNGVRSHHTAC